MTCQLSYADIATDNPLKYVVFYLPAKTEEFVPTLPQDLPPSLSATVPSSLSPSLFPSCHLFLDPLTLPLSFSFPFPLPCPSSLHSLPIFFFDSMSQSLLPRFPSSFFSS